MNIGKLKYRVTFRQATKTRDSVGGYTVAYSDVFSTWADVKQGVGTKDLQFDMTSTEQVYQIIIRTRFDFRPNQNWECTYNGKTLQIHNVVEIDKDVMKILAYENKRAETGNIATDWSQA